MSEIKLCKDCKHVNWMAMRWRQGDPTSETGGYPLRPYARCSAPLLASKVDGENPMPECEDMRKPGDLILGGPPCGPSGKLWEPRA